MSDDLIHDRATIRAGWDDDDPEVTRIARRVGAALNSGRDKAVVDVVLDETETLRREVERWRIANADIVMACAELDWATDGTPQSAVRHVWEVVRRQRAAEATIAKVHNVALTFEQDRWTDWRADDVAKEIRAALDAS